MNKTVIFPKSKKKVIVNLYPTISARETKQTNK